MVFDIVLSVTVVILAIGCVRMNNVIRDLYEMLCETDCYLMELCKRLNKLEKK